MTKKKATVDDTKKRKVTDAPESNAGDDFHVLWAVRKSVELINLDDDGLKALTLEGTIINDATDIDPDGDKMLGVDLGEYFGGEDFESANKVVFSQLKYSTRHSNTPWSIASICQGKKHKYTGSIIHRLAEIYSGYECKFDRNIVLDKLTLKLISNRPFVESSAEVIEKTQNILSLHPNKFSFAKLKALIDAKMHDALDKLLAASSLPSGKFTDFLRLLDFSECGVASRSVLKEEIILSISRVNGIESARNYDSLHVKIWNKMMPENRIKNKLTIIDILKTFNFSAVEKLLPVPAKFDYDNVLVPRKQSENIIDAIFDSENSPICLHAGAGMGKSTIVRLIEQNLPRDCVSIVFDCYGAGSYMDVVDKRHKADWALMQICNELAIKTGSPFMLLPPGQPIEVFFREFLDRLKIASEIVRNVQPNARVVIIIDAADNSITAAEHSSESSFVEEIVKMALPPGCTLLLTTRTHRLGSLHLPVRHRSIELEPFTQEETQKRLTAIFPEANSNQIKQFHDLTRGIPRVQTYALANQEAGLDKLLEPLKPDGKTVDDLISVNLDFVSSKLGNRELMETVFRYMILLPRPFPLTLLCELAAAKETVIKDLVIDTAQGVVLKDGALMFTDEDFEAYLRQHYPSNYSDLENIASILLAQADREEYASKHIGNFLLLTERYEELKSIVFNKKYLVVPKDPVILKEIAIDRTRQAMKLSLREKKIVDFLKLQILAAEAAKTDDTLTETLLSNADLTAMYGDRNTVENLYFKSDRLTWYGPVHYRCAAVYARNTGTINEAKAHLKTAHSWLDWRTREPWKEREFYQIDIIDLAFATEAICRLENVKEAMNWLWRRFYHKMDIVAQLLLKNSLDYGTINEVDEAVSSFQWKLPARLNIISAYFTAGVKVPFDTFNLGNELDDAFNGRHLLNFSTKQKVIHIAEYLAVHGEENSEILKLLQYSTISPLNSFPRFYRSNFRNDKEFAHLDMLFRSKALFSAVHDTTLTIEQLYPKRFKKTDDRNLSMSESTKEEKERLDNLFGAVLPFYSLRAKFLAQKIDEKTFLDEIEAHSRLLHRNYSLYAYNRELPHFNVYYGEVFSDIAIYIEDKNRYIKLLKDCFCTKDNHISLLLGIANNISRCKTAHISTLALLKEADDLIYDAQTDASGKISDFLTCVRIGGKIDHSVGQAYFKKMVETVSEMDIEGFDQIKFIAQLSSSSNGIYPETAYMFTRFVEYAHSRLKNWDNFPWEEAIDGSAHLDPKGTIALVCRWDHLRFIKLKYSIVPAIEQAFNRKMIEPEMAGALLYVNSSYGNNFVRHCNQLLEALVTKKSVFVDAIATEIFQLIRYDCPNYRRPEMVKVLRSKLQEGSILIADIDIFLSFYEKKDKTCQIQPISNNEQRINLPQNLNPNDSAAIKSFLKDSAGEYRSAEKKLEAIREICSVSQYLGFLNIILELDDEDLHYYGRQQLLNSTLALWQDHPALNDWKKEKFEQFFIKIFPNYLSHNDIFNHPSLIEAAKIFGADEMQLAEVIKRILPAYIDTLS
ncbi:MULTISPECIES: NACHT domain-containing protein [Sphingobacterium]|uniref:NACHT domain-containing protein n=1 Tax=Sphingobacterium TaxID=28453 RepID=UPI000E00690B|nr:MULTISPECIES: NACHT domain-containing protein [Sphingobacterium]QQT46238.1 NACHT domain-containing protein [Sphingobacterium multivorum]SUJ31699.1 NACHT domain [Sphingobacterium multivorum]HAF34858.1 hypothetical protein [Sphingobacterium sp.]